MVNKGGVAKLPSYIYLNKKTNMAIQTKDDAQGKADKRLDRNLHKQKKEKPLMEREFSELVSLADQLEWIKRKQKQNDKNQTF
jgi:hypothetical protein